MFKQLGPVPEYPKNPNAPRDFVLQAHFRGKSVHLDLRIVLEDFAEGWTISAAQEGAIKVPVLTYSQGKKVAFDPEIWKFDLETGLIFPREVQTTIRGKKRTIIRPGSLYAERKAQVIPKEWLEVEGVTGFPPDWPKTIINYWNDLPDSVKKELRQQGFDPEWARQAIKDKSWDVDEIPVGATRSFPGVFVVLDKGKATLGARKPYFFEYFIEEGNVLPERICFRMVVRAKSLVFQELVKERGGIVLPPGVEEEAPRSAGYWVYTTPDPRPYVLSEEAYDKDWLPPKGVAALPQKLQKMAPKEMRFWEKSGDKERLQAREELMNWYEEHFGEEIRESEEAIELIAEQKKTKFKLFEQTYRGQIVIRWGPSTLLYWLLLDDPKLVVSLENSPLLRQEVAGLEMEHDYWEPLWEIREEEEPKPGTLLNPTKETPSKIKLIDAGNVTVMEQEPGFLRLKFEGEKLKGFYNIVWESEDSPILIFERAKEIKADVDEDFAVFSRDGETSQLTIVTKEGAWSFAFEQPVSSELEGLAILTKRADFSQEEALGPENAKAKKFLVTSFVCDNSDSPDVITFSLDEKIYEARKVGPTRYYVAPLKTRNLVFLPKSASDWEQIVYGVVLSPYGPDAHGDIFPPEEVARAAHFYLAFGRQVGLHHVGDPIEAYVVESFIAPQDLMYGDQLVRKGEWVMAVWIPDRNVWQRLLEGEFQGFSILGFGIREDLGNSLNQ